MAAINPNALWKFVGILEIRTAGSSDTWTRLPSIRGLISSIDTTAESVEIVADDTGTVFRWYIPEVTIEAELLEDMDRDLIDLLFDWTPTDVAGSATPVTGEVIQAWAVVVWKGTVYNIINKNWDNSVVSSVVVDDNWTPLTLNTDYTLNVDTDWSVTGTIGTSYITFLTDTGWVWDVDVDYSYTPNASEQTILNISFAENPNFEVRITATDDAKNRIITISSAAFEWVYGMSFLDVVEAGDITGATLNFSGNKAATFTYYDEIL